MTIPHLMQAAPWILVAAASDAELSPAAVRVYVTLFDLLDCGAETRPVKVAWLVRRTVLGPSAVSTALRQLERRGYLARGPDDGRLRTYRLTVSPSSYPSPYPSTDERPPA